jgi:hypothetical protein
VIAAIAVAVWSPWLWELQSKGGYAAIQANHSRYLVGLSGWFDSLVTQSRNLTVLEGSAGQHSPFAAFLVAIAWGAIGNRRFTWNRLAATFPFWLVLGLSLALSAVCPGWLLVALFGCSALLATLLMPIPIPDTDARERFRLALWLLAAWFVGLSLTTPLYNPYPRLTLPWVTATWLAAGLGCCLLVSFLKQVVSDSRSDARLDPGPRLSGRLTPAMRRLLLWGTIGACLVGIGFLETQIYPRGVPGWESRTDIQRVAAEIDHDCASRFPGPVGSAEPYVIYTLSEPGLLFQLKLRGTDEVRPIGSLSLAGPTVPPPQLTSFVAIGSLAEGLPGFSDQFAVATKRLEPLAGDLEFEPSMVVRLDSPGASRDPKDAGPYPKQQPRYQLKVYELR